MKLVALLCLLGSPALATAQTATVEFVELLVNPVGPDAGAQKVELRNTGNVPADLTGWVLVTAAGTFAMPPVVVPAYDIVLAHVGQTGTSTATAIFLPTLPVLTNSATLALFRSSATSNPGELVDFVSWGGGQTTMALAIAAGQWPNAANTITVPAQEGHTMAHYEHATYVSRSRSESWFVDGTPTLGAANDGGGIFAGGYGCPQLTYGPQLGNGEDDNRPWLGEVWQLGTSYMPVLPTVMWVAFGLQSVGPVPLDPLGIPGCFWETSLDVVAAATISTYPQALQFPLPLQQAFVGSILYYQAAVAAPGTNPAGLLITRAMIAFPGLR